MLSFALWVMPFIIRVFFIDIPAEPMPVQSSVPINEPVTPAVKVIESLQKNDRKNAFILVCRNNLKGCMINIGGGIFLGLGTSLNLMINGFYSADVFVTSYRSGQTISQIVNVTLPHSFELIGFWLSGAVGFYIAWNFILFIKSRECFTALFYKKVGALTAVVFIIILMAAYVEIYISIN